jgi:hypothetical protein
MLTATFYWIGLAMSVLCVGLAWARNTELVGQFERVDFPLSWAAGAVAILAFLAAEYCHPVLPKKPRRALAELPENLRWEPEFGD